MSRDEFAAYSHVMFMLSVTNQHGFESNSMQTEVGLGKRNTVLYSVNI